MSELENPEVSEEVNEETGEETQEEERQEQAVLDAEKQQAAFEAGEKQRAVDAGWVDKSDFRGPAKNWRDYDEYNKRADEMMPIMRAELKGTKEENEELKGKLVGLESVVKKMTTVQDKFGEDSYNKSISDIKAQKLEAVEAGDTERYQQLEEQEALIVKPESVQTETEPGAQTEPEHPSLTQWKEDNPWFDVEKDPRMARYAVMIGNELSEANDPTAVAGREAEFGAKITAEVKAAFPDKFTNSNPNQNRSDMVESSIRGTETTETENGAKGWDDLPAEAKQQCRKLMAEDEGYTKEDYIKLYPFDED